jgi:hypothetical protein
MMRGLFKGAGAGIIGSVNEARAKASPTAAAPASTIPSRPKMRGPTVNLNELKD